MEFFVEAKGHVKRMLDNMDYSLKEQILKVFQSLKFDPHRKGKCLGTTNSGMVLYEKRIFARGGFRIYYSVFHGAIIVLDIQYEGKVLIHHVGKKRSQKQDIAKLKREN